MSEYLNNGRRIFLALTVSIAVIFTPFIDRYSKLSAASSEDERIIGLMEGAKKEETVSFYTALSVDDVRVVVGKFHEKYPFIKVDLYRASNLAVLNRLLIENKANRRINDVVMVTGDMTMAIKDNGLLAKYSSPESKFYPNAFKDKDGYWTDHHISVHAVVYNTRLVSPKEVPVKYKDLLNPKWKGKIGINLNNHMWPAAIIDSMGEREGLEFLNALSRQNTTVRRGGYLTTMLVAAGELALGVSVNANTVEEVKEKGATVDWIRLNEPVYADLHPVALNAQAPHPNAGKLLIDFLLSEEGQNLGLQLGQISARTGMRPSYIKTENIRPLKPAPGKDSGYYQKLIKNIFVK